MSEQAKANAAGQALAGRQVTRNEWIGIAAGFAGLALLLADLVWWAVKKTFKAPQWTLLILGAAAIIAFIVLCRKLIAEWWRQRSARQFVNSAAFTLFVAGILVLANVIAARHHKRWDLTKEKRYALSEQSMKIIKGLDKTVEIFAFVSPRYYRYEQVHELLREYETASPKLRVHYFDPKVHRDKVQEFNVQFDGTIIVKCGERKEEVTGGTEEQITSAILAVTTGEKTKLYFLTGHGEKDIDSYSEQGLASLKRVLENQQYEVKELTLALQKQPKVPDDCAVLCIIGPQKKLLPKEVKAINRYLDQGGNLFVCLEPPPAPSLNEILSGHGLKALDGTIMDPAANLNGIPAIPAVLRPEEHEITRGLALLIFPTARAIEVEEQESEPQYPGAPPPPPRKKGVELVLTSEEAWLESSYDPSKPAKHDPGERSGRLCIAAAVDEGEKPPTPPGMPEEEENEGPKTRIVVVGDSDFVTEALVPTFQYNLAFAAKAIAWLAKKEKLVSIPPKSTTPSYIAISGPQLKLVIVLVFALPLAVLIAGGVVWALRRGG